MSTARLEENKRLVSKVFEVAFGRGDNFHLLDEVIAEDYIQHNPDAGQGLAGVKRFFMEELVARKLEEADEHKTLTERYIAEGDFVVRQDIRRAGMLVDIFRVERGLIREHWDAYRPEPGFPRPPGTW